jgi:hypothetical protein
MLSIKLSAKLSWYDLLQRIPPEIDTFLTAIQIPSQAQQNDPSASAAWGPRAEQVADAMHAPVQEAFKTCFESVRPLLRIEMIVARLSLILVVPIYV